ncbi:glycosyltransferase [Massilia sp. NR 4-1]|uniref:glycosyltransferase n=1 Tax=Massilia sp. NR 4-1 TaxID=1678028 RepID=UPI00067DC8F2|nr:glycosyltransferase [Massilia sp. NR 4-1]AKU24716.1 glycosyltransferase [Massilia sp. NR 4-1]
MASHNGAATLPKVLSAYCLLQAPPCAWRLLFIDNASTDATRSIVESYAGYLPLCYLFEAKRGKNAALNTGLAVALRDPQCSLLVFSDDDATPEPGWLRQLWLAAGEQSGYAIFGGGIVADWAATPPEWVLRLMPLGVSFGLTKPDRPASPIFPGLVWGANMALRRSLFDTGLRFDESLGPRGTSYAMGSETSLLRQLGEAGERAWFCPQARVAHHIRAAQLTLPSLLQRAWRFGRGQFRQDRAGQFPEMNPVPRWMLGKYLQELGGLLRTQFGGGRDARIRHRWELAYLGGYFYEALRAMLGWNENRRRILITSYSGELGGMELRMAEEARFLAAAGYESALAVKPFPGSGSWLRQLRASRLAACHFCVPPFLEEWRWRHWNLGKAILLCASYLARRQVDLLHVAFCWTGYGASSVWLAARCGIPTVISVHNAFPPSQPSAWQQAFLRQAFSSVRGVYAVSASAMEHFLAHYRAILPARARLAVIPNCVDTDKFLPSAARRHAARQQWQLPADALVLGVVGRLSRQKRPEAAIRLLSALREEFSNLYLVLAGSGELERPLRAQASALGVQDRVMFTGFQTQMEELMPAFDLHLLLSSVEGFGIVTIEAMACGVPTVATDVPGSSDVLCGSGGGLLLPLDDEDALAAAVAALLRDPQRRLAMGGQGRREAEVLYSRRRVQSMVHEFYRDLL